MLLCRPLCHNQIGEEQWGLGKRQGKVHILVHMCMHIYLFRSVLHAFEGRGLICSGCERKSLAFWGRPHIASACVYWFMGLWRKSVICHLSSLFFMSSFSLWFPKILLPEKQRRRENKEWEKRHESWLLSMAGQNHVRQMTCHSGYVLEIIHWWIFDMPA